MSEQEKSERERFREQIEAQERRLEALDKRLEEVEANLAKFTGACPDQRFAPPAGQPGTRTH